jgi:hypothetical protein
MERLTSGILRQGSDAVVIVGLAEADSEFPQTRGGDGEPMHGWLGFAALGSQGTIGVVELVSHEMRCRIRRCWE